MGKNVDHLAVQVIVAHKSPCKRLPLVRFRIDQEGRGEMCGAHLLSLPAVRTALRQLVADFTVHTHGHKCNAPVFAERADDTGHQVVDGIIPPVEEEQTIALCHLTDDRILNLSLFGKTRFHRTVVVTTFHVGKRQRSTVLTLIYW